MREHQSPFTNIAYDNLGDGARIAKQLQNQLAQSVILGESQQRLTQRIRSVTGVELNRARRIAQTERVRVQSEGRQLGFNEATAMGVEMDKQWIARLVNTRDTHAELHGTIIPAAESFVTKNGPLEFPGDPNAPAAEIVNCHCFVKPMVKSAAPELAAHREKFHEDMKFEEFRKNRLTNARNSGIMSAGGGKMKNFRDVNGYRQSPHNVLSKNDIENLNRHIEEIEADKSVFRFNEGSRTGYNDEADAVMVKGDVYPDLNSKHPRDLMSERAVLAHEYYGHYHFSPSQYRPNDWRDEMRASYIAALKTPNLSYQDRRYLMLDSYERAKEAGHIFEYSKKARVIIYGF